MNTSKPRFFSADNLHRALWGLIIAVVTFVATTIYHRNVTPPKVVIEPKQQTPIPVVVENPPENNDEALKQLLDLTRSEIRDLSKNQKNELNDLKKHVAEARDSIKSLETKKPIPAPSPGIDTQRDRTGNLRDRSAPEVSAREYDFYYPEGQKVPGEIRFKLPDAFEGYIPVKIHGVVNIACPPKTLPLKTRVLAGFKAVDPDLIDKISPLSVKIINNTNPERLVFYHSHWRAISMGENTVVGPLMEKLGSYEMRFGYFHLDEIHEQYPRYYSAPCTFNVVSDL